MPNEIAKKTVEEHVSETANKAPKTTSNTRKIEDFKVGDIVIVGSKIQEAGGVRVQNFEGIVIATRGEGVSKTFTVRKIGVTDIGVERIFPLFSPNIVSVTIKKHNKVKRAKLYYLREKKRKSSLTV